MSMLKLYQNLLNKYPMTCQSIQTGILMGVGDVIAQTGMEKKPLKQLEIVRTMQFASVGCFLVGPSCAAWYKFMANRVTSKDAHRHSEGVVALKKVALDQLCFSPIGLAATLTTLSAMKGKDIDHIKEDVGSQYWDVLTSNYEVWPGVQLVNFYLVPLRYQLLFVQLVAIAWNVYLSERTQHP